MTKAPTLRVKAFSRTIPAPPGYVGTTTYYGQRLQRRFGPFWITLDQEEVPAHVKISMGAFGDTGGWVSKFAKLGAFGRDGVIRAKTA